LQKSIPGITSKVLSKELKELEENQLVARRVHDTPPITVEYAWTSYAKTLDKVINELLAWGTSHRSKLMNGEN
jgi:DNA-binding HxlR family transcriptional regulator